VPAGGSIQSPVLIGRDDFVALAGRRLGEAAAGAGQLLFVAGEAGIGKTRLLGSIARHAQASGFAVVRAAAFPGDVQSFAGLLLDLAGDLTRAPAAVLSERPPVTRITVAACWCRTWSTCSSRPNPAARC